MTNFKEKVDLICKITGLLLWDYRHSNYGKVIPPMTVLRRLDTVLAPTKEKVLELLSRVEKFSDNAKYKVL